MKNSTYYHNVCCFNLALLYKSNICIRIYTEKKIYSYTHVNLTFLYKNIFELIYLCVLQIGVFYVTSTLHLWSVDWCGKRGSLKHEDPPQWYISIPITFYWHIASWYKLDTSWLWRRWLAYVMYLFSLHDRFLSVLLWVMSGSLYILENECRFSKQSGKRQIGSSDLGHRNDVFPPLPHVIHSIWSLVSLFELTAQMWSFLTLYRYFWEKQQLRS